MDVRKFKNKFKQELADKDKEEERQRLIRLSKRLGKRKIGKFKIKVEREGKEFIVEQEELDLDKIDGKIISTKSPIYIIPPE